MSFDIYRLEQHIIYRYPQRYSQYPPGHRRHLLQIPRHSQSERVQAHSNWTARESDRSTSFACSNLNSMQSKRVPKPTLELVIRLAELGWLYKQVAEFVHECSTSTSKGLITQVRRPFGYLLSNTQ